MDSVARQSRFRELHGEPEKPEEIAERRKLLDEGTRVAEKASRAGAKLRRLKSYNAIYRERQHGTLGDRK